MDFAAPFLIAVLRRFRLFTAIFLLLLAGAAGVLAFSRFSSDINDVFPENSEAGRALRLIRQSGISNRMVLELDFAPEKVDEASVARIAGKLGTVPGVHPQYRIDFTDVTAGLRERAENTAFLTSASVLDGADPGAIARNTLRQMLFPVAGTAQLRSDPLGTASGYARQMRSFYELSGLDFSLDSEVFTSRSGSQAMILLDVPAAAGDGGAARALVAAIDGIMAREEIAYTIVAPHLHTIANEDVLKRDVAVVSVLGIAFLLLLFGAVYRFDPVSFLIPAIPFAASVLAAGVTALLFREVHLAILGMGAAVAGLAVDAGIHVYTACRGECRVRSTARLALPLLTGIGTTAGVFFLLTASGIRAYAFLGVFAGLSLLFTLVISFFGLPALTGKQKKPGALDRVRLPEFRYNGLIGGIFFLLLFAAAFAAAGVGFDFSIDRFDGSPPELLRSEAEFQARWRKAPQPALLLLTAGEEERLLERCETAAGALRKRGIDCFALTDLQPTRRTMAANCESWHGNDKVEEFRKELAAAMAEQGLPAAFFDPFFRNLNRNTFPVRSYGQFRNLIRCESGVWSTVVLFPDTVENVRIARELILPGEQAAVISPESFTQMIGHDFMKRFPLILPAGILFVLVCVLLITRSLKETLAAMAPMAAALILIPAFFALAGKPVNLMHCLAGVILAGITIDYGIFGLYAVKDKRNKTIPQAMTLAFLSTFFGVSVLLASKHPVLFDTGLTLSLGIIIAYFCGMFVTPVIYRGTVKKALPLLFLLLLPGCAVNPFVGEPAGTVLPEEPYVFRANVVFEHPFFTTPVVLVSRVDSVERTILTAGFNPVGIKFFEVGGEVDSVLLPIDEKEKKRLAAAIRADLEHILLDRSPPPEAEKRTENGRVIYRFRSPEKEKMCYIYVDGRLVEKESRGWFFRNWRVRYYGSGIFYEGDGYTLVLREVGR